MYQSGEGLQKSHSIIHTLPCSEDSLNISERKRLIKDEWKSLEWSNMAAEILWAPVNRPILVGRRDAGSPRVSADSQCRTSAKADIVLLVDGSWSIGRINFKTIRSFIGRMVGVFEIGPNNVQIGNRPSLSHRCLKLSNISEHQYTPSIIPV